MWRWIRVAGFNIAILCTMQSVACAQDGPLDLSRPACGKVCKLVCETKKLTAICYANECKQICLPGCSRPGCKHCATCCGKCKCEPCAGCEESAPKCEFCWRDWFACGCPKPRSVKVLTKYQAEKKICWYHWEVVDASCCDCASQTGEAAGAGSLGIAQSPSTRSFYKPAPDDAAIGDVLEVTEDEWVKLAAAMTPDPQETTAQISANSAAAPDAAAKNASSDITPLGPESNRPSLAERFERLFRK
jgi:hypothetical protein